MDGYNHQSQDLHRITRLPTPSGLGSGPLSDTRTPSVEAWRYGRIQMPTPRCNTRPTRRLWCIRPNRATSDRGGLNATGQPRDKPEALLAARRFGVLLNLSPRQVLRLPIERVSLGYRTIRYRKEAIDALISANTRN